MGFKQVDVTPFQVSPLQPTGKSHLVKIFQVARTDTGVTVKCVLPAQSSIINVWIYGTTASDAATSAAVTITVANNTGTISTGSYDVKTNGGTTGVIQMSNLPNIEPTPLTGDLTITGVYAENGASTTGGPWKIVVEYVA